jgi:hypothetical protein
MICLAAIKDISGKWMGSVKLPNGSDLDVTYVFKVDGGKLSGTSEANGGPADIANCKINGPDFSFTVQGDGTSVIPHTGKYYADGDSISMKIDFNGTVLHTTLRRLK